MKVAMCMNGLFATRAIQVDGYDMAAFSCNGFTIVHAKPNFPVKKSIPNAVTVGPPYSEIPYDTYLVPKTPINVLLEMLASMLNCSVDDLRLDSPKPASVTS